MKNAISPQVSPKNKANPEELAQRERQFGLCFSSIISIIYCISQ